MTFWTVFQQNAKHDFKTTSSPHLTHFLTTSRQHLTHFLTKSRQHWKVNGLHGWRFSSSFWQKWFSVVDIFKKMADRQPERRRWRWRRNHFIDAHIYITTYYNLSRASALLTIQTYKRSWGNFRARRVHAYTWNMCKCVRVFVSLRVCIRACLKYVQERRNLEL